MKVVITGGAGFLGRRLAVKLLERGTLAGPDGQPRRIDEIALVDIVSGSGLDDARVRKPQPRERGAAIDRPLSAPGQMRTLWIKDPDGVSNYFAEFAGNDNAPR